MSLVIGNDEIVNEIWQDRNELQRQIIDIKRILFEFSNPEEIDHETLILRICDLKNDSIQFENLVQHLYE